MPALSFNKSNGPGLKAGSVSLTGLFVLALLYTAHLARSILLPLTLALFFAFLLRPVIRLLGRIRLPAMAAAGLVLLSLLAVAGYGLTALSQPALEWIERAPESLRQIGGKMEHLLSPFRKAGRTAEELRTLAEGKTGNEVRVKGGPGIAAAVVSGMQEVLTQAVLMLILLFFMLASGDLFLVKLMNLYAAEDERRQVAEIVREVEHSISRYLLTITLINAGEGFFVGLGMYLIGMPDPLLWGVMAALLVFIPYLGPLVGIVTVTVVAVLALPDLARALLAPLLYLVITTVQGQFLTPLILGARFRMNPVAIFIWLILWGAIWGVIGAIMAVPLLTVLKLLCERIDPLRPVAGFLSD